ncbi:CPBP family intramembrane metalloprotease [bacterium]|nr:CPBP family intramembrane metalloprotease [bacterium]
MVLGLVAFQFVIGFAALFAAGFVEGMAATLGRRPPVPPNPDAATIFALAAGATLVFALLAAGRRYGRDARRALAVRLPAGKHLVLVLLLLLPLLVVAGVVTAELTAAARAAGVPVGLTGPTAGLVDSLRDYPGWRAAAVVVGFLGVAIGVGEEVLFRGVLGRGLVARWGLWRGIGLTTVLFGAFHIYPVQAAVAGLIGLVLHAAYLWTRSLSVPVVLHAGYNCLAVLGGLAGAGAGADPAGDAGVPSGVAVTGVAAGAAVGWALYRTRTRWALPDGAVWSPGFPTAESPPAAAGARLVVGRAGVGAVALVAAAYLAFAAAVVLG